MGFDYYQPFIQQAEAQARYQQTDQAKQEQPFQVANMAALARINTTRADEGERSAAISKEASALLKSAFSSGTNASAADTLATLGNTYAAAGMGQQAEQALQMSQLAAQREERASLIKAQAEDKQIQAQQRQNDLMVQYLGKATNQEELDQGIATMKAQGIEVPQQFTKYSPATMAAIYWAGLNAQQRLQDLSIRTKDQRAKEEEERKRREDIRKEEERRTRDAIAARKVDVAERREDRIAKEGGHGAKPSNMKVSEGDVKQAKDMITQMFPELKSKGGKVGEGIDQYAREAVREAMQDPDYLNNPNRDLSSAIHKQIQRKSANIQKDTSLFGPDKSSYGGKGASAKDPLQGGSKDLSTYKQGSFYKFPQGVMRYKGDGKFEQVQ